MRYFFYANRPDRGGVIVVDESAERVTVYPPERVNEWSTRKTDWLDYYAGLDEEGRKLSMWEICKNQFTKFANTGVVPDNHDAYFVAQRNKRA